MTNNVQTVQSNLYRAATTSFDFNNPSEALSELLALATQLTGAERAALYEFDEDGSGFTPRIAEGMALGDLGRLSSTAEHPVLREVIENHRAVATDGTAGSMGLPLAPGIVACAPCFTGDKTFGLMFVANNRGQPFSEDDLSTLEVLAARSAEVLAFARQTASRDYLFHKLSLLYQASHAITGTREREETIRQMAAHVLKATSANICEVQVLEDGMEHTSRFQQPLGQAVPHTVTSDVSVNVPDYPIHDQVLSKLTPATISLQPPVGSGEDIALLQSEGYTAAAIFPLAVGNDPLGLVRILYDQPGRQISEQEMELAQAIVNIGAIGLQDAIHLETAESRANQLQVLSEIGREMTSNLDLEVALENSMRYAQEMLQAEACVLFLMDEEGEELVLKASGGRVMRVKDVAIRLEEGIAGWVARNKTPLIVNDVRTNPLYQSAIDAQTGLLTSSVICVPLEARGEILGVIEAINNPHGAFNKTDQQMLSSVASWAAIALDNANLFQRVAEERSRLEATLVETADAVVLTSPAGRIILINKAAGRIFRINTEKAVGRPADDIFFGHPLGDALMSQTIELPTTLEVTTPYDRTLYATISEVTDVGRVAVMQDITALKQIDKMRAQLLGTAAHDLKNPLNAIRLGADLLADAPFSDQQRKALDMMRRATDSMTNLITGLLETIRVESTANILSEPTNINDLIRRGIEDLRPLTEARNHTIRYDPPEESLLIMGDPNRLNSVMSNLLSNAIKYTDPGGLIEVTVRWDDDEITISVKDNGPGIPEEELPRVFEHLFRGRAAVRDPNNPVDGTGLGLALAKTVIEQHGGRLWVESEEDKGSIFRFALPREATPKTGSLKPDEER
ncbi:MAG: GAF domain-containing protein [Chloroflexi bacterium]|nr:GAF domain-containing protein [Chloroflexota bacterium]